MSTYLDEQKVLFDNYLKNVLLYSEQEYSSIKVVQKTLNFVNDNINDFRCDFYYNLSSRDTKNDIDDFEIFFNNSKLILDYYAKQNIFFPHIEINNQQINKQENLIQVLDELFNYYQYYYNLFSNDVFEEIKPDITLHFDLKLILQDISYIEILNQYYIKYNKLLNIHLNINFYTNHSDLLFNTYEINLEMFFDFIKNSSSNIWLMIDSSFISAYNIDDLYWWNEQYKKYEINELGLPNFKDVRHTQWEESLIIKYQEFLEDVFTLLLKAFDNDIVKFTQYLCQKIDNKIIAPLTMTVIDLDQFMENDNLKCHLSQTITINCSNLSLICCSCLHGDLWTGAYFIKNEDNTQIIDYDINNIDGYITIHSLKSTSLPICANCIYNQICQHGCLKIQEYCGKDILLPKQSVCKFFTAKYNTLFKLYHENKIWEEIFNNDYYSVYVLSIFHKLLKQLGYNDYD